MDKQLETTAVKMQVETLQLSSHHMEHRCFLWAEVDPHLTPISCQGFAGSNEVSLPCPCMKECTQRPPSSFFSIPFISLLSISFLVPFKLCTS